MASRQIHDDVRNLRKEMSLLRGQFQCQVCNETLSVDPEDKKTFLSRTEHDEVFGMQLVTYRVAHTAGDERHINTIIVDRDGFYRGHRDFYSESIRQRDQPRVNHYFTIFREVASLSRHHLVNLAFITDRQERWVLEIVNPGSVKTRDLALMAVNVVEEAEKVCDSLPGPLTGKMWDRELAIWSIDSRLLCIEATSSRSIALMDRFATLLENSQQYSQLPNKHMIILAMRLIDRDPDFLYTPDLVFHF